MSADIPVGSPHRALETIELLVYQYDALGVELGTLRAGAIFQPWAPLHHDRVPITLGEGGIEFRWNVAMPAGRFLWREDFVERCARADASQAKARARTKESPIASPFAELDAIAGRLRNAAIAAADREMVEGVLAQLATLHASHARAAEAQRAAEGFDNTGSAREYADAQARLLAEAREMLRSVQTRLRATA